MISIRSEQSRDVSAREVLLDDVFGFDRHEKHASVCVKAVCRPKDCL